jgi:hypothetical protein
LNGFTSGPEWSAKALVPPVPKFTALCPKLAKIAPEEAARYDAAWLKWEQDFVYRLTRGANQN